MSALNIQQKICWRPFFEKVSTLSICDKTDQQTMT